MDAVYHACIYQYLSKCPLTFQYMIMPRLHPQIVNATKSKTF